MKRRSANPKYFLTSEEAEHVESAIKSAEKKTSGEIKVYMDRHCWGKLKDKATDVFNRLGLWKTAQRNGVLIYLVLANREFYILADEGINSKVPTGFWDDIAKKMVAKFKEDKFADGLCEAISEIGEKLATYFPYRKGDIDEISDKVEKSD